MSTGIYTESNCPWQCTFRVGFAKYFKNVSHERKVVFFIRLYTLEVLQPNAVILLQLLSLEFKLETTMKRAVQLKNEVTKKKKKNQVLM